MARFVSWPEVAERFHGKRIAIVGSGPSSKDCAPGYIDSHEVVVRVNNYRTGEGQGERTDVFYSFFGTSIKKAVEDLKNDGVTLCIAKCPNSKPLQCDWHERTNRQVGIDYRYIYDQRAAWWFCDTFIPDDERYLAKFRLLENHIPTTGFAAILDVLECEPRYTTITGFDFFTSGLHNVDEKWRPGDPNDPICHDPQREAKELVKLARQHVIGFDRKLAGILADVRLAPFRP